MQRISLPLRPQVPDVEPLLPLHEVGRRPARSTSGRSPERGHTPRSLFRDNPKTPRTPSSRGSHSNPRSLPSASPSVLRPLPIAHQVASEATRDELRALTRQSRHLESRLQAQLDAQSAGLIAGLGLEGHDDGSSDASSEQRGSSAKRGAGPSSPSRSSRNEHPRVPAVYDTSPNRAPTLPATRRAIHGTLLELAELRAHEAQVLHTTLEPLDEFLSKATSLEQKRAGLHDALAEQDVSGPRAELKSLEEEEEALQREILELEGTLAAKRNRLKHVKSRRIHDASTLDARLSSWRQAAAEVDARIRDEILAGRGLPWRDTRTRQRRAGTEDVWNLPTTRRTMDLVKESVEHDRIAVIDAQRAANHEARAAAAGANVWQEAVGAVRGVERALRREMRRLSSGGATRKFAQSDAATEAEIPLDTLHRPGLDAGPNTHYGSASLESSAPSTAAGSFATARTHAAGASGSASTVLPRPSSTLPPTDDAMHGMHTVLAQMDAAIARLAADVTLSAERGWQLLVVAIGAELAALREGRRVLGRAVGESARDESGDAHHRGEEIEMQAPRRSPRHGQITTPSEQRAEDVSTPTAGPSQGPPLASLTRADTEDDAPSFDLLVETD